MTLFDTETPVPAVTSAAAGTVHEAGRAPSREAACTRPALEIHVVGTPAPQGSKRGFVNPHTGRVAMVESSKKVKPWRQDVRYAVNDAVAAREGAGDPFATLSGPVGVDITFLLPRPKGHYRTGKNAHLLRDSAPARPTSKPDVDKLLRSTLDALRDAGVYGDDAQVVNLTGRKRYATAHAGAVIQIYTGDQT